MTDQPWELNRYTRFTLVYVLVTIVADGLGLLLGAIANPVVSIIRFYFFRIFVFKKLIFQFFDSFKHTIKNTFHFRKY